MTPTKEDFDSVMTAASLALEDAQKNKQEHKWSVNWADLHCFNISFCQTMDDDKFWLVEFSEASPDEWKFWAWMRDKMKEIRPEDFRYDIRTEW